MPEPNPVVLDFQQARSGYCECGCGQKTELAKRTDSARGVVKGQPRRFLKGHVKGLGPKGRTHHLYNGGLTYTPDGRCRIRCWDGTKVFYYRALLEAELKRPLQPEEIVHHINGDPTDDRLENLELTTFSSHARLHAEWRRRAA